MAGQNRIKTPASKTIRSKVDIYLKERRQAGFRLKTNGLYLQSFSRFAENRHHRGPIAVQLAVAWAQASHRPNIRTAAHRLKELQPFFEVLEHTRSCESARIRKAFGKGLSPRAASCLYNKGDP